MALEKRTVKIIAVVLGGIIVVVLLGILLAHLLRTDPIELEVWPRGSDGSAEPLISYDSRDRSSHLAWVQRIDDFLDDYRPTRKNGELRPGTKNLFNCDFNDRLPPGDKVCDVSLRDLHPCISENHYNYHRGAPCVFLKLNKILNWTPMFYNTTGDLPGNMPEELKQKIGVKAGSPEANEVWVSCEGESPADQEFIGPVQYIPRQGFPAYYLTSMKNEGYLSPLVAVLFGRPKNGVIINVVCKAWAKNIACEDCEPAASVHFQLLLD